MAGGFLAKLLFTVLVIVIVWRAKRIWDETQRRLAQAEAERKRQARTPAPMELAPCKLCGTYVPRGTACTSREHCRYEAARAG
jgi:hypothetical protein